MSKWYLMLKITKIEIQSKCIILELKTIPLYNKSHSYSLLCFFQNLFSSCVDLQMVVQLLQSGPQLSYSLTIWPVKRLKSREGEHFCFAFYYQKLTTSGTAGREFSCILNSGVVLSVISLSSTGTRIARSFLLFL